MKIFVFILLLLPLSLLDTYSNRKDVLYISSVDTPTRIKGLCNIPDSVSWEEIHSNDKYRRMLAEKLKSWGMRVERVHR